VIFCPLSRSENSVIARSRTMTTNSRHQKCLTPPPGKRRPPNVYPIEERVVVPPVRDMPFAAGMLVCGWGRGRR
jgi:hypothetical protein